jgi:hypothetical protein
VIARAAFGGPVLRGMQGPEALAEPGSPNFTQLPVNAPKCPIAHFQQDGHMAMMNPAGLVNCEPNSWDPPGPREDSAAGFRTYPDGQGDEAGPKRRLRPESFADHYSQARQFFSSQTDVEQRHIIDAFTFELSKCGGSASRARPQAGAPCGPWRARTRDSTRPAWTNSSPGRDSRRTFSRIFV